MATVKFDIGKNDKQALETIAHRARALAARLGVEYGLMDAQMDVAAVHSNGNPLDLHALASADDANFGHDVFGIRRYLNRRTGKLTDCFVPRFSLRKA